MKSTITVEEAKRLYHQSRFCAGREFNKIIVIKGNSMQVVCKMIWSSKQSIENDMKIIENADMLFDGEF